MPSGTVLDVGSMRLRCLSIPAQHVANHWCSFSSIKGGIVGTATDMVQGIYIVVFFLLSGLPEPIHS